LIRELRLLTSQLYTWKTSDELYNITSRVVFKSFESLMGTIVTSLWRRIQHSNLNVYNVKIMLGRASNKHTCRLQFATICTARCEKDQSSDNALLSYRFVR